MNLEETVAKLCQGDPDARDRLRTMGPEAADAAPALADAVARGDRQVRLDAMFVLEGLGEHGSAAIPNLVEALRDEDMDVSAQAAETLGALGYDAVPAVIGALEDADWRVRQAACQALGIIGADATEAVPALLQVIQGDKDEVRHRGVWALGAIGDISALDPLAEILTREGGTVGVWIAEALGSYGRRARTVAAALRDELHRDHRGLALAAAAALCRIEEYADAAVWTLITYLQQGAPDDRIEAAMALGDFGPAARAALPALKAAERDEDDDLRAQAVIALAKIRPEFARTETEPSAP
ncbi:MAG: HEAT repeat domain-containing protein [Planctomycetota bacterium]